MSSPLVPFNALLVGATDEKIGGTPVFSGFSGGLPVFTIQGCDHITGVEPTKAAEAARRDPALKLP